MKFDMPTKGSRKRIKRCRTQNRTHVLNNGRTLAILQVNTAVKYHCPVLRNPYRHHHYCHKKKKNIIVIFNIASLNVCSPLTTPSV